jgi:hypothetical protein
MVRLTLAGLSISFATNPNLEARHAKAHCCHRLHIVARRPGSKLIALSTERRHFKHSLVSRLAAEDGARRRRFATWRLLSWKSKTSVGRSGLVVRSMV